MRGGAHGNVPCDGTWDEVIELGFWPRPCGNQNVYTSACRRRFDGLMAQLADRAGVRERIGMVMPDLSQRRP
jgi:hypothetical protein